MIRCANCDEVINGKPHYHELRPEFEEIPFCNRYCREEFLTDYSFEQGEPYDDTFDILTHDNQDRYYDSSPAVHAVMSGFSFFKVKD